MNLPWDVRATKPVKKKREKYWIIDYSFYMYSGSFAHRYKCSCRSKKTGEPRKNCSKCNGDGFQYMQSQNGHPTGGLFSVLKQITQMAKAGFKIITVFDPPKDQLDRMKLLDTYKGGRPPVPDWITYQMDYGQNLLPYTNVECYYSDHAESDDVMAAIAIKLADEGHYVVVSSDDKDMFPLLEHKNIDLFRQKNIFRVSDFHKHILKKEKIKIKNPGRFNEFLAICGDAADNFNLLNGLGPKAAEWIISNTNKSCLEIFDNFDKVPFKFQKKLVSCSKHDDEKCPGKSCINCKWMIEKKKNDLKLSLQIATLDYNADYRKINKQPDKEKVIELLSFLDLKSALNDIQYLF